MPHHEIIQTQSIKAIQNKIREKNISLSEFQFYSNRFIRIILENCFEFLPYNNAISNTPVGEAYNGTVLAKDLCTVSVIRAGESMETEFNSMIQNVPNGKILVQRDKISKKPKFFYQSLPEDIKERFVIVFEPMIATGGSAILVIEKLLKLGVEPKNIIFANVLAAPIGIKRIMDTYPNVQIVSGSLEEKLDQNAYMIPGIGDFGDRYFGTVS